MVTQFIYILRSFENLYCLGLRHSTKFSPFLIKFSTNLSFVGKQQTIMSNDWAITTSCIKKSSSQSSHSEALSTELQAVDLKSTQHCSAPLLTNCNVQCDFRRCPFLQVFYQHNKAGGEKQKTVNVWMADARLTTFSRVRCPIIKD